MSCTECLGVSQCISEMVVYFSGWNWKSTELNSFKIELCCGSVQNVFQSIMAEVWLCLFVNLCICHSSFTFLHFEVVVLVSTHLTGLAQRIVIGDMGPKKARQQSLRSVLFAMVPTGFRTRWAMAKTTQAISSPLAIWSQQPQGKKSRHFELLCYLRNYEQVVAISVWFRQV
jgi:hypothetical protein